MNRRRSVRRIIAKACVFLLLGAIVNIAVAWGCAWWSGRPLSTTTQRKPDEAITEVWICQYPFQESESPSLFVKARARGLESCYVLAQSVYLVVTHAGWPYPALRGESWTRWDEQVVVRGAIAAESLGLVRWPDDWGMFFGRCFPFMPLWPGFAINTLFYAAILWLLFAAPIALRRRQRIKRGLCPACAYPIGASEVCTECGRPVKPQKPEPQSR